MDAVIYIMKRLFWSTLVLFGLSILIFGIARIIPGDPAVMALGSDATEEALELYRQENCLNEPYHRQYLFWLSGALKGSLGNSTQTNRNVTQDIKEFLPITLELIIFAGFLQAVFGLLLGVASARKAGGFIDNSVRLLSYIGISTPAFIWAILFMLIFSLKLQVLPTLGIISEITKLPPNITGLMLLDSLLTGNIKTFWDVFKHMLMPGTALAFSGIAQAARVTRTSMVENMNKDYVSAELASGIPYKRVMRVYLLRPSVLPTITTLSLNFASMLGNAFVVEQIFNIPGISKYGMNAILNKDLNAIVGVVMVTGITFLVVNIVVDIAAAYLDPRIRLQGG